MSTAPLYLAIDQGGQSTRVAIYDGSGEQLACFSSPCTTRSYVDADGGICVEQDGAEILAGLRASLQRVDAFLGTARTRLKAAGFAGQGSSLLAWDTQTGVPLSPVLSWQDRRAEGALNALPLTTDDVRMRTGLRISPHYGASKIRWCLDHLPAVQAAYQSGSLCIGPIASYLFWHLLSVRDADEQRSCQIDPGHAQRTLLWNLATGEWDSTLLDTFGISASLLPECRQHTSHFGDLIIGDLRVPMVSCQRDQGASLFARGMPEAGACYVNIGTGAFIQRVTDRWETPEGLLVSPLWLAESAENSGLYAWEATVNGAAAALDWLAGEAGLDRITPEVIARALVQNPQEPIYLLNAVGGLSAPYWRTDLNSKFSGELDSAEKILVWIESVVFQIAVNLTLMQRFETADKIFISGGLSRADGLCQRLADLTGLTVYRSGNADATLQGIAFTAAGFPQAWRDHSADQIFVPQANVGLHARYAAWQVAMESWLLSAQ